jgi:predicted ATPase
LSERYRRPCAKRRRWSASGTAIRGICPPSFLSRPRGYGNFRGAPRLTTSRSTPASHQDGRPADADATLNKALSVAEESHDRCHEAELHRLKGELALAHGGNPDAAEAYFQRSIEIAKQQQSKAWELRGTTSIARLYQGQSRHAEARDRLSETYAKFTQGFETPDLQDANSLLVELRNA